VNSTATTWSAAILLAAASAGRVCAQQYLFDSGTGAVTFGGSATSNVSGAPVSSSISGGVCTWVVRGDINIQVGQSVRFVGPNLARVLVGGNLSLASSSSISASGSAGTPGPGGGAAGSGSAGGTGGAGGLGGAQTSSGPGANGDSGFSPSIGWNSGMGAFAFARGGDGAPGDLNDGDPGMAGNLGAAGHAGAAGQPGSAGLSGGRGVNNTAALAAGGFGGSAGSGGSAGTSGAIGGGGAGGVGLGVAGGVGQTGGTGGNGGGPGGGASGGRGANAAAQLPGSDLFLLTGGNGGGGGGGAGGGGGGAGGGGGGGGSGAGHIFGQGGGGGGGGGGAAGGSGGAGANGYGGFGGGAGGGGVQIIVQGRIDSAGTFTARGGDGGWTSLFTNGAAGSAGGTGGAGALSGFGGGSQGGAGGTGGNGGTGADGGAQFGPGAGGGGAGGTVFLVATYMSGTNVDVGGGATRPGFGVGGNGRVIRSEAATATVSHSTLNAVQSTLATSGVPTYPSPYFAGLVTPNIVHDSASGFPLTGGPGPFGMLPFSNADATINNVRNSHPARALAALIRYPTGPSQYTLGYNLVDATSTVSTFDMYVLVNLYNGAPAPCTFNGVQVGRLPYARRTEFGGPGTVENVTLPFLNAWACLGPRDGDSDVALSVGGYTHTVRALDGGAAVTVVYLMGPCGPADLGSQGGIAGADGALDNNDFIAFIDLFFSNDPRADLGRQGGVAGADGVLDNNDFVMFINYFFATGACQ
jgi:hypothetical protein